MGTPRGIQNNFGALLPIGERVWKSLCPSCGGGNRSLTLSFPTDEDRILIEGGCCDSLRAGLAAGLAESDLILA